MLVFLDFDGTLHPLWTFERILQPYLRRPGYAGPWLALDDDDELWPVDQRQHLVHAAGTLADFAVQRELAAVLARCVARQ